MSRVTRLLPRALTLTLITLTIFGCATQDDSAYVRCVASVTAVGTGVGAAASGGGSALAGAGVGAVAALGICQAPEKTQSLEPQTIAAPVAPGPAIECAGGRAGADPGECSVQLDDSLKASFENAADVAGALASTRARRIPDRRPQCHVNPRPGTGELVLYDYPGAGGGFLTIPGYLCGIPNAQQEPEIVIVDVRGDLTVTNSVIFHEARNPPDNTDYACRDRHNRDSVPGDFQPGTQPVLGWLPQADEIPVLNEDGQVVNVLEDLTSGCGSYRGGTGRMSFLVYNLHHVDEANYQAITAADVGQLKATLQQTVPCAPDAQELITSTATGLIADIGHAVERRSYDEALGLLLDFGALLAPAPESAYPDWLPAKFEGASLASRIEDCVYNPEAEPPVQPGPGTLAPRNFRGDLLSQVDHIRYMLVTMLGAELRQSFELNFALDSAVLPSGTDELLTPAIALVSKYPDARFLVVGHTDSTGSASYNEQLSLRRAEALRSALLAAGIGQDRIDVRGEGEKRPVAANDSPSGRARNRRVELSLSE